MQLDDQRGDHDSADTLQAARNSVQKMASLINELLHYALAGSEEEPELVPTDCSEVIAKALASLELEISQNAAVIHCDQLPVVSARPSLLLLVFQNLVGNAIHYRRDQRPEISINVLDKGDHWLFGVADNGAGIQPEDRSRIFEMFARAHAELRPGGTGIGLAMCRRIVEDLGGRIWVESQPGVGSNFLFTLPKVSDRAMQAQDDRMPVST